MRRNTPLATDRTTNGTHADHAPVAGRAPRRTTAGLAAATLVPATVVAAFVAPVATALVATAALAVAVAATAARRNRPPTRERTHDPGDGETEHGGVPAD